jgi:hypothetical protein
MCQIFNEIQEIITSDHKYYNVRMNSVRSFAKLHLYQQQIHAKANYVLQSSKERV